MRFQPGAQMPWPWHRRTTERLEEDDIVGTVHLEWFKAPSSGNHGFCSLSNRRVGILGKLGEDRLMAQFVYVWMYKV